MRTVKTKVYTFDELSDEAKERARDYIKTSDFDIFGWSEDWKASINAFVDHFGADLRDWQIGPWSPISYEVVAANSNFRGLKLRGFDRDHMPTGYCCDCNLWQTFYDEFKRTGDAKHAFEQAVHAGFTGWQKDWEAAYDDEALDDFIIGNGYEFTEDGNWF